MQVKDLKIVKIMLKNVDHKKIIDYIDDHNFKAMHWGGIEVHLVNGKSAKKDVAIYQHSCRGEVIDELVLPLTRDYSDYDDKMYDAIVFMANVRGQDFLSVLSAIAKYNILAYSTLFMLKDYRVGDF